MGASSIRSCESCLLCCKLPAIRELGKPAYKWCDHAKPHSGCTRYDTRPQECRDFNCLWLTDASFGPEWHPARSKFYLAIKPNGTLVVMIDPAFPASWRQPKYYNRLREISTRLLNQGGYVLVVNGRNAIIILPHKEIATTMPPDGSGLTLKAVQDGAKVDFEVIVVPTT